MIRLHAMELNRLLFTASRVCLLIAIATFVTCLVEGQQREQREMAVRSLIKEFADARNAHDGNRVAALYSEGGIWMQHDAVAIVSSREELARMWGGLPGHVERTITSIDFPGQNIAVVKVRTDYAPPTGPGHSEVFIVTNERRGSEVDWKIRIHQTLN
jgi:uncharacterized protein (TIGR02246 family)